MTASSWRIGLQLSRFGPCEQRLRYCRQANPLPTLHPPLPEDAQRLREFLAASGYTHQHFQETAALRELPQRSGANPELLAHTADPTALNLLLRWFFAGMPQAEAAAPQVLPRDITDLLIE